MSCNNYLIPSSIISISLITLYLLIPIAFSSEEDIERGYTCAPPTNKTFNSIYNESRALMAIDVIVNTPSNQGFRKASYTWLNDTKEWAYGIALCRGDVSATDCKTCVNNATITVIYTRCPDSRSAIIWRNFCFFKYSDVDFFGIIDTTNVYYWPRYTSPVSPNITDLALNLMASLKKTATASPMLYANDTSQLTKGTTIIYTLYGVVQCTRDLSTGNCNSCLETAITELVKRGPTLGARVFYGSCNIRFDLYNFLAD